MDSEISLTAFAFTCIREARQALERGQSVTQAFSCSGYHSMSAFIRAFRTVTGMPPSTYRKQCTET